MACDLLFKELSLGNGAGGGLLGLFDFQDTSDISATVSPEAWLHPCENKDGMNNYLGFTRHPRKCIKHNCLCSVLPRCELLILHSSGPCQHRGVGGSSGAKPRVHAPLQHEPVVPRARITLLTMHNQLEVGPHESR